MKTPEETALLRQKPRWRSCRPTSLTGAVCRCELLRDACSACACSSGKLPWRYPSSVSAELCREMMPCLLAKNAWCDPSGDVGLKSMDDWSRREPPTKDWPEAKATSGAA
eukprot:scaffold434_cov186-Pinguiococcus_pyrenoidosus.AAC.10